MKKFKEILIIGLIILYFLLGFMFFFSIIYLIGNWDMSYTIKSALFLDKYLLHTIIKTITYILKLVIISHNLNEETFFIIGSLTTIALCFLFYSIYYTIILICLFYLLSSNDLNLIIRKLKIDNFYFILEWIVSIIFSIIFCVLYYIIIYIIQYNILLYCIHYIMLYYIYYILL